MDENEKSDRLLNPKAGEPLHWEEALELDSYGPINGRMALPRRIIDLWEREILYGSPATERFKGLLG